MALGISDYLMHRSDCLTTGALVDIFAFATSDLLDTGSFADPLHKLPYRVYTDGFDEVVPGLSPFPVSHRVEVHRNVLT